MYATAQAAIADAVERANTRPSGRHLSAAAAQMLKPVTTEQEDSDNDDVSVRELTEATVRSESSERVPTAEPARVQVENTVPEQLELARQAIVGRRRLTLWKRFVDTTEATYGESFALQSVAEQLTQLRKSYGTMNGFLDNLMRFEKHPSAARHRRVDLIESLRTALATVVAATLQLPDPVQWSMLSPCSTFVKKLLATEAQSARLRDAFAEYVHMLCQSYTPEVVSDAATTACALSHGRRQVPEAAPGVR